MNVINKAVNGVKKWLFKKAVKKAIITIATYLAAVFSAKKIILTGTINGQEFNSTNAECLTAFLIGIYEMVRNWLKIKYPKKFNWL